MRCAVCGHRFSFLTSPSSAPILGHEWVSIGQHDYITSNTETHTQTRLPTPVWQEFTVEGDLDAVTFGIGNLVHMSFEIDRAHDSVAEFFVDL